MNLALNKNPKSIRAAGMGVVGPRVFSRFAQKFPQASVMVSEKRPETPEPQHQRNGLLQDENQFRATMSPLSERADLEKERMLQNSNVKIVYDQDVKPQGVNGHHFDGDYDVGLVATGKPSDDLGFAFHDLTNKQHFTVCFTGLPLNPLGDSLLKFGGQLKKKEKDDTFFFSHDPKTHRTTVSGFINPEAYGATDEKLPVFAYQALQEARSELPSKNNKKVKDKIKNATGATEGEKPKFHTQKLFIAKTATLSDKDIGVGTRICVMPIQSGSAVEMGDKDGETALKGVQLGLTADAIGKSILSQRRKALSQKLGSILSTQNEYSGIQDNVLEKVIFNVLSDYNAGKIPQNDAKSNTKMLKECIETVKRIAGDLEGQFIPQDKMIINMCKQFDEGLYGDVAVTPSYSLEKAPNAYKAFQMFNRVSEQDKKKLEPYCENPGRLSVNFSEENLNAITEKFRQAYKGESLKDDDYQSILKAVQEKRTGFDEAYVKKIEEYGLLSPFYAKKK